ncbi:Uncharacterized protein Rs2_04369 [Raphanus sativus]|nr:Uncharacterized protein Rs2_04369 [Raphanus sativus]
MPQSSAMKTDRLIRIAKVSFGISHDLVSCIQIPEVRSSYHRLEHHTLSRCWDAVAATYRRRAKFLRLTNPLSRTLVRVVSENRRANLFHWSLIFSSNCLTATWEWRSKVEKRLTKPRAVTVEESPEI